VVPFRNGIMLSIAAGIAESHNLKYVMMANHGGDHAIYPDCRPSFVEAMSKATQEGTYPGIQILAPYTDITKADIAMKGKALGIDYTKTWSCYKGGEHHCGKCGTCVERREALAAAGIPDETIYDD
ncbi:MAG: 7-cyano-7-deazaguanine synthase, partial [Prevotella sp.]|nr:7-cyano-7-deazaguanine synthase [Prevotella sp.]